MTEPVKHALARLSRLAMSEEDREAITAFGRECFAAGHDAGAKDALEYVRLMAQEEQEKNDENAGVDNR